MDGAAPEPASTPSTRVDDAGGAGSSADTASSGQIGAEATAHVVVVHTASRPPSAAAETTSGHVPAAGSGGGGERSVPTTPAGEGAGGAGGAGAGAVAPPEASGTHAYITMITSDSFLPGLQVMAHTLSETGTSVPLHVMVTPQVSAPVVGRVSKLPGVAGVIHVEPIANPNSNVHVEGWVNSGYTKLHLWGLEQFSKVVYIDADTLVQENVDELFDRDVPLGRLAAAPDVFPPDKFNAGVLVLRPCRTELDRMLKVVSELPSHDGGDTGFLNSFYPEWFSWPATCRLPFAFNALRTMYWLTGKAAPGYWESVKPIRILHYCSSPKPWDAGAKKGPMEMIWWASFLQAQAAASGGARGGSGAAVSALLRQFAGM